jgi:hypothetical protein
MADIYPDEGSSGVIDIGKARDALKLSAGMNDAQRRAHVAEITAAAMLDIAASLRPIGAEAASALNWASTTEEPESEPVTARIGGELEHVYVTGDIVAVDGAAEPGEIIDFGMDQGSMTATIRFADGVESRVWVSDIRHLDDDDRDDDSTQAAAEAKVRAVEAERLGLITLDERNAELAKLNAAADAEGEIDDDFDAPATALDALKAKSKKKGGKK